MIVPSPRRSRSTSASSKPSVVRTSAFKRSSESGVTASPTSRQRLSSAPRPTRPRSWWSWAMPKREASRTTMTVAFGTSTPTSITVVATSTSRAPERKRRMVSSFSAGPTLPWSRPTRRSDRTPPVSAPCVSSADLTSSASDSSMSGQTTYAWWPAATSSRTIDHTLAPSSSSSTSQSVRIGMRPGGISSMTETSRSP